LCRDVSCPVGRLFAAGSEIYIGFFDIGYTTELDTRRMHLRYRPKSSTTERFAQDLADQIKEVLERCMAHLVLLDSARAFKDHSAAATVIESYDVSLWILAWGMRQVHLDKINPKKVNHKRESDHQRAPQGWHHSWSDNNKWHAGE
jgi:hypothetical protein